MDDLVLRDVVEEDLPVLFIHQTDRDAIEMAAFPARDHDAFTAHWAKVLADHTVTKKAILYGGSVAGHIVSWDSAGERLVGYWLGKEYWGRGIATRALQLFLTQVTARPLRAHVAKHNIGSLRVLEKCGFRVVGSAGTSVRGVTAEELVLALDAV